MIAYFRTSRISLDEEAQTIHIALKRSGFRDRFDFVTRWASEPLDLLRELRELNPTVVHFSGHGSDRLPSDMMKAVLDGGNVIVSAAEDNLHGLYLDNAAGSVQLLTAEVIARVFEVVSTRVQLVVLSACYTDPIAKALLAHVDSVVGTSGAIHDDLARSFAIGLYGGLSEHESIAIAFKQGTAAINLNDLPDADRPKLQVRDGFDAAQLMATVTRSFIVDVPCPYPGMRPFRVDDTARFHGRDRDIHELISRLRGGEREIYVIGPSGSGKSSLVAAGVLPRLARGVPGLGPCIVRTLRPGAQPATRLFEALGQPHGQPSTAADGVAALLAHRSAGSWLLIVIDQMEELFSLASRAERDTFVGALLALRSERSCAVIVTLRADFLGALLESPLWSGRVLERLALIEVAPLYGEALREAITMPVQEIGVAIEPELVERLLADIAAEPGSLALLQETLVQLWHARVDQTLTLANYQALGDGVRNGIAVTLARRADGMLRRLDAAQVKIARRMLLRLITFGEGRPDTRRQLPRAQLHAAGEDTADVQFVLDAMVDDRLLAVDDAGVDLAHETLITAWPQLAEWIRAHRGDEQRRRRLETAAAEWVAYGRGTGGLLDRIELVVAEEWCQTESAVQLGTSADIAALVAASRAEHGRQRWRLRLLLGALAALVVVAVLMAALAFRTSGRTSP